MAEYFITQAYSLAEERGYVRVEPPLEQPVIDTLVGRTAARAQIDGMMPRTTSTDLNFEAPSTEAAIAISVLVRTCLEEIGHSVIQAEGLRRLAPYQLYIRGSQHP